MKAGKFQSYPVWPVILVTPDNSGPPKAEQVKALFEDAAKNLPGVNRDLFSVGHGVTIADADGAGIAVCPLDHPLVALDRPGCWQASQDAAEFTPKKPVVYLNLYNNQWNTNTIPGKLTSATPVNLRGEPAHHSLVINRGTLSFRLHAYAPASFILE